MAYRTHQVERGKEATDLVVAFIEAHYGTLEGTSVHERNFSTGSHGRPDVVFREYGIEVKRVEFMASHDTKERRRFYNHLNNVGILHESWDALKEWCTTHLKHPILIVVLTCGRQKPIFIGFSQSQIDTLQQAQRHKKSVQLNSWQILQQGTMLKTPNFAMVYT